jgi:hypothetical protein
MLWFVGLKGKVANEGMIDYASVVFVGFGVIAAVWYGVYARKGISISLLLLLSLSDFPILTSSLIVYKGPPASDGLS